MKNKLLNELNWELNKLVEQRMKDNPYANEEVVREYIARQFADWLVSKFKEDSDDYEA